MEEKKKSLQLFLIKRFVITIILVGVAEIGVTFIQNNFFVPFIYKYYFNEIQGIKSLSGMEITFLCLMTLVQLLVLALKSLFPSYTAGVFEEWSNWVGSKTFQIIPESPKQYNVIELPRIQAILLFLVILVSFVLTVFPYIVEIYIYSKTVVMEFRKIQKREEEIKQEHYRKRNLLLSDIAHDLRTPMTTVGGYSKALLDGMIGDSDKEQEYLEAIYRKSLRMN